MHDGGVLDTAGSPKNVTGKRFISDRFLCERRNYERGRMRDTGQPHMRRRGMAARTGRVNWNKEIEMRFRVHDGVVFGSRDRSVKKYRKRR